ncbi:MAG: alpha/beta hydrolase-fold protein [Bradymonadia bacterium]|jgi:predicted alpha/beta superfamily hydrolase
MRLHRLFLLFLSFMLIFAGYSCDEGTSIKKDPQVDPTNPDPTNPDPTNPDTTNPDPIVKDAEYWARASIAGSVDTLEAFTTISQTTGFPVKCKDGKYLFLHWHDQGSWSIAGDFNEWNPQEMTKAGEDLWYSEISVSQAAGSGYKFVYNNSDYQADTWSRSYQYDDFGEISYVEPPKTVHLERYHRFAGQGLKPRTLRVYVPAGSGPWPVLYAHDGQNLFSPYAIGNGWKLREALAQISANFLVVGIDNTEDRMNEYTHVDDKVFGEVFVSKGKEYAAFVHDDVRNFIEKQYPTKELRGLMGSSLGGLISLYIAHLYPDSYDIALSLSGTLAWGRFGLDNTTMLKLYQNAGKRDFTIYADSGGGPGDGCSTGQEDAHKDENDRDNYCATKAFVDGLSAMGYEYEKNLYHWHEPEAEHNEAAWAARVFRPLTLFKNLDK